MSGLEVPGLHFVRNAAREDNVLKIALAHYAVTLGVRFARADDYQAKIRKVPLKFAIGEQEVFQALSFLKSAQEEEVRPAIHQFGQRLGKRKLVNVYTVGYDIVFSGEVLADELHGGFGYGYPAVQSPYQRLYQLV